MTAPNRAALDAALAYAELGLRVVPCCCPGPTSTREEPWCEMHPQCGRGAGKRPLLDDWVNAASADPGVIRQWFATWKYANVGVALGTKSGYVSLDIDGTGGERLLAELLGDLPETWAIRTGNGRRLLFRIPDGLEADPKTAAIKSTCGGELRLQSTGGQCVMPPSLHYTGVPYDWEPGHSPDEIECAPMPPSVVALGTPQPRASDPLPARTRDDYGPSDAKLIEKRVAPYLSKLPPSVEGRGGHSACFYAARVLVTGFKLSEADALAVLSEHFNPRCQPPWSWRELEHKVRQALNHPFGKPAGWLLDKPGPKSSAGGLGGGPARPGAIAPTAPMAPPTPGGRVEAQLVCFKDIEERPVPWLWPDYIPQGRLTSFVGRAGVGKSFLTCDLAARLSVGGEWPDSAPVGGAGDTLLIVAEDDDHDTIRPRLGAAGADVARVYRLKAAQVTAPDGGVSFVAFDLANIDLIRDALGRLPGCRLVVIDPVGGFIGGRTDTSKDNQVRAVLQPLADLAAEKGVAVVLVMHTRKAASEFADDSAMGSRAFIALSRIVFHFSHDRGDSGRVLMLAGKCNLGPSPRGRAYRIPRVGKGVTPRIEWEKEGNDLRADDVQAAEGKRSGPRPKALEAAMEFLSDILSGGGGCRKPSRPPPRTPTSRRRRCGGPGRNSG